MKILIRVLLAITVFYFIMPVTFYFGYADDPKAKRKVTIYFEGTEFADGYKIHINKYFGHDGVFKNVRVVDVGIPDEIVDGRYRVQVEVLKYSRSSRICFSLSAYATAPDGTFVESKRSREFCENEN